MRAEIQSQINNCQRGELSLVALKIKDKELPEILDQIIQKLPNVTTISFQNNSITDIGAKLLASELPTLQKLSILDLQFNQIDKEGIEALLTLNLNVFLHGNKVVDTGEMQQMVEKFGKRNRR